MRLPQLRQLALGLLLLGLVFPVTAAAAPRLLLVQPAEGEPAQLSRTLADELVLSLDSVEVESIPVPTAAFFSSSLGQQLELLRPILAEAEVLASGWIDPTSEEKLRFHLVFASSERAVARIVEVSPGPEATMELALAIREQLRAALVPRAPTVEAQGEPEGDSNPPPPAEPAPDSETPAPRGPMSLVLQATLGGALATEVRSRPHGGIRLALDGRLLDHLRIGFGLIFLGSGGPDDVQALALGGELRASWLPGSEAIGAGPVLRSRWSWLRVEAPAAGGEREAASLVEARVSGGLGLRVRLSDSLALAADLTASWLPRRNQVKLRSDGSTSFDSGSVALGGSIGLQIQL